MLPLALSIFAVAGLTVAILWHECRAKSPRAWREELESD